MAVTDIDLIRDRSQEAWRVLRHRLSERRLHVVAPPSEPLGMLWPSLGQAADELVEDLAAPRRTIETALSEAEQHVADHPRVEDARVEERDIRHETL